MRVRSRQVGGSTIQTQRTRTGGTRGSHSGVQGVFKATLQAAEEEIIRGDLDQLLREVDRCGAELRRWRGKSQLEAYRRAVQSFLQTALEQMYQVNSQMRFNSHGRRVRSVIVQAIDEHLEALTEEILHGSKSMLPLAARLDEIRGLLFDLYG